MHTKVITDPVAAAKEITDGNIVALPTETVYGLGASALYADAVLKIFNAKERPLFNPLIVHIYSKDEFSKYAENIPESAYKLIDKFSPGPITYVFQRRNPENDIIPQIVSSGLSSIALRLPSHSLFREVLKISGQPICAPSANRFGKISPVSATDVLKELDGKIRYILDGGKCSVGIESTVISFFNEVPEILRPGAITAESIMSVIGEIKQPIEEEISHSPGMLKDHYAPNKELLIINKINEEITDEAKRNKIKNIPDGKPGILVLSGYSDLNKAAIDLFSKLRELDESDLDYLIAESVPDTGIGIAINDRLKKAASGSIQNINGELKVIPK
ncbi:L-threonylcarbamoyladenylate synthase [soil metagenome]